MKFCSACGASVDYKVPEDDSRERASQLSAFRVDPLGDQPAVCTCKAEGSVTLLSDLDFQVRCHRTADEKVVSVPTFRAEISLARVLTALGTITWWDGMGLQTQVPPGMGPGMPMIVVSPYTGMQVQVAVPPGVPPDTGMLHRT